MTNTADVTCTCPTGPATTTPVREESRNFVVTTWTCDGCAGQVSAHWTLKAA